MKNKLEVGMYVRTKEGVIGKYNVIKEFENVPNFNGFYETKEMEREYIDNKPFRNYAIKKASFNLIDLIEVGDFVNGCRVIEIIPKEKAEDNLIRLTTKESAIYGVRINELEIHIKSILTHEQYNSNKYVIGDDKDE